MGLLPREQLRQLIKENDIKDVNGIYDTLKDMFKDVLQEMLEAEMDVTLGYSKNCILHNINGQSCKRNSPLLQQ